MKNEFLEELKKAHVWSWITIAKGWNGCNIRMVLGNSDEAAKTLKQQNKELSLKDIKEGMAWLEENELNIAFWDTLTLVSKKLYAERQKEIRSIPEEIKKLVGSTFYKINTETWNAEIFLIEDVIIDESIQKVWIKSKQREREVLPIESKIILTWKSVLSSKFVEEIWEPKSSLKKYVYFKADGFKENNNYLKFFNS